MKFSKLPKEKRQQFVLVIVVAVAVLAALGFGLIRYQYRSLQRLSTQRVEVADKLEQMENSIKRAGDLETELENSRKVLSELEASMASGDLYDWIINTVRRYRLGHKVEIPQFGQSVAVTDMNLIPKFPYKQASLLVAGTAHYHDLGRFIADFENQFPHVRILNLDVETQPGGAGGDREKLVFKMDVVTLVKPESN